jgi:hypothetical protein
MEIYDRRDAIRSTYPLGQVEVEQLLRLRTVTHCTHTVDGPPVRDGRRRGYNRPGGKYDRGENHHRGRDTKRG